MLLSYMLVTGEFGIVYKAHLLQVEDDDIIVAVKTLIGKTCIMHISVYSFSVLYITVQIIWQVCIALILKQ